MSWLEPNQVRPMLCKGLVTGRVVKASWVPPHHPGPDRADAPRTQWTGTCIAGGDRYCGHSVRSLPDCDGNLAPALDPQVCSKPSASAQLFWVEGFFLDLSKRLRCCFSRYL
ncbi:hypothetical protein N657DRAFT_200763 [Parathielavia appendiculata]|uniref:Uncharacterized protein n=1 Tax=Parathielavia appendiculata TaxID=2587402 RepID=A0AAN6Z7L5_9PEZI|nr:hypothetical protein N657DRAFT_200763 [Parathielavia appendiculata]